MKKVKSFVTHPVTLLAATTAVLYFGWKLVVATGWEMMVAGFLLGIITIFSAGLHVRTVFYGAKEIRDRRKKKLKPAAFTAISSMIISTIVLASVAVLPILCGLEGVFLGILLLVVTEAIYALIFHIWWMLAPYFRLCNVVGKESNC
jgi:hypothetical protein